MDPTTQRTPSTARGKRSRFISLAAISIAALMVGSCTNTGAAPPAATSSTLTPSASLPAGRTGEPSPSLTAGPTDAAEFPVTLTDDEGTRVTLDVEPQRIVSLTPANTEIVFTLGQGERIVGGTDSDDFPEGAADPPDVVTLTEVVIERIVELDPDLVLAGGTLFTPPADIARLRDLGLPVIVVYAETVDEVFADIELVGAAIGAMDGSTTLTDGMRSRIDEVAAATSAIGETPRVFYEIDTTGAIYGPARDSFIADMIVLAGGDPITSNDPAVFSIPLDRLITADPEVIVLGDAIYGVCPEQVADRRQWRDMTAVREGAIRPVNDIIVTRPGPRLAEGVAALAAAIHPDVVLDPAPPDPPACEP